MKRILRKVASIFVATAMVAALGVSAMAAGMPDTGIEEGSNLGDPVETTITLYKGLKFYNPDETQIQAPNISYAYAITAGDADKQITDDQGVSVKTKAGITTGLTITGSVAWTDADTVTASAAGTEDLKDIVISFANVTFNAAGVYRYVITETVTPSDPAKAGVTDGGSSATRYLDVYVKDGDTAGTYVIYGYVCFEKNLDHIDDTNGTASADAVKTKGFVDASSTDATLTGDSYYTYNVTVGKTLVNDNANINNQFPFTVTFSNTTITENINLISKNNGTVTLVEIAAAPINGLESKPTIANGGTVKYVGIPCGTTVNVFETNNVQTSAYKAKCDDADTTAAEKLINYNDASNTASVTTTAGETGEAKTVTFVNTLELISPTGVALAILPFVILFTFGVGFLVAGTAKRKEDEA